MKNGDKVHNTTPPGRIWERRKDPHNPKYHTWEIQEADQVRKNVPYIEKEYQSYCTAECDHKDMCRESIIDMDTLKVDDISEHTIEYSLRKLHRKITPNMVDAISEYANLMDKDSYNIQPVRGYYGQEIEITFKEDTINRILEGLLTDPTWKDKTGVRSYIDNAGGTITPGKLPITDLKNHLLEQRSYTRDVKKILSSPSQITSASILTSGIEVLPKNKREYDATAPVKLSQSQREKSPVDGVAVKMDDRVILVDGFARVNGRRDATILVIE